LAGLVVADNGDAVAFWHNLTVSVEIVGLLGLLETFTFIEVAALKHPLLLA
jgi:hypothetical protein